MGKKVDAPQSTLLFRRQSVTSTRSTRLIAILCLGTLAAGVTASTQEPKPLGPLVLPAGFRSEIFAEQVQNARSMALGAEGTVFVGSQYARTVYALVDRNGDHKVDRVVVIAT